jgi:ABC-type cobalamin/Fe3+-siderophores transport system ATPase subunit
MIKVICGKNGSGKTKKMIDMVNDVCKTSTGSVVCIEQGMQLTYDISYRCRLIAANEYNIKGYEEFYGFLAGVLAGNYDISEVFVDGILKIGNKDLLGLADLLKRVEALAENINVTITVSADENELPDEVKKYL